MSRVGKRGEPQGQSPASKASDACEVDRSASECLLSLLAHELRRPLGPIITALEIMRQRQSKEGGQRARLVIERQMSELVQTVDDMLDLSKLEDGLLTLRLAPAELTEIVAETARALTPVFEYREQTLVLNPSVSSVPLIADKTRLEQALSTMLRTASVTVECGNIIQVDVSHAADAAIVRIRDGGAHSTADDMEAPRSEGLLLPRIQERASAFGVGVSLAQRLVAMHAGHVEVMTRGNIATEFRVTLPTAGPSTSHSGIT